MKAFPAAAPTVVGFTVMGLVGHHGRTLGTLVLLLAPIAGVVQFPGDTMSAAKIGASWSSR